MRNKVKLLKPVHSHIQFGNEEGQEILSKRNAFSQISFGKTIERKISFWKRRQ